MEMHIAKGVFDILPKDPTPEGEWRHSHLWQYIESVSREIACLFGFREIRTPVFEKTELFSRSIGESTDIVSKEMYTFLDKAGRSLTLRPEGTAPVMRAFIEKHLDQLGLPQKFFYLLPMFRYERQQAGRYRQHHQFGVEFIGTASPYADAECLHLLSSFYKTLGIKNVVLHLNSIGSIETRNAYRRALKEFLFPHLNQLSQDSQHRYETNPLRILDSKDPTDKEICKDVPSILDFLKGVEKDDFDCLCHLLDDLKISYQLDPLLVRGLDYYNKTVFEFTASTVGSQNAIGGGGRFDGLLKQLGGPDLPAFGFGAGLERILQVLISQNIAFPIPPFPILFITTIGDVALKEGFKLLAQLRDEKIAAEMDFSGKKLKSALKTADSLNAQYILILGEDELKTHKYLLKEMETGDSHPVDADQVVSWLKNKKNKKVSS